MQISERLRRAELEFIHDTLGEWGVSFVAEQDNLFARYPPHTTAIDMMQRVCDVCRLSADGEVLELRFHEEFVHRSNNPSVSSYVDNVMFMIGGSCLQDNLFDAHNPLNNMWRIRLVEPGNGQLMRRMVELWADGEQHSERATAIKAVMYDFLEL